MNKIIQILPFRDKEFHIDIVGMGLKESGEVVFLKSTDDGIEEFDSFPNICTIRKETASNWYLIYADDPEEAAERLQDFEARSGVRVLKITPVAREQDFSLLIEYID